MSNVRDGEFEVRLAGLDEIAQDHVVEAVAEAEADGVPVSQIDGDALVRDGEALADAHERVEDLREAQEAALAEGDLETAKDLAFESEWAMREVSDLDPEVADGIVDAEADQEHLAAAIDDAEVADAAAVDAAEFAEVGMDGASVVYAETADAHAVDAAEHVDAVTTASQDHSHDDWHGE